VHHRHLIILLARAAGQLPYDGMPCIAFLPGANVIILPIRQFYVKILCSLDEDRPGSGLSMIGFFTRQNM